MKYADLGDFKENDRIDMIGNAVMKQPASSSDKPVIIAFITDNNEKADRYIKKLQKKFPGIRVIDRFDGPVPNTVRVGPPLR